MSRTLGQSNDILLKLNASRPTPPTNPHENAHTGTHQTPSINPNLQGRPQISMCVGGRLCEWVYKSKSEHSKHTSTINKHHRQHTINGIYNFHYHYDK